MSLVLDKLLALSLVLSIATNLRFYQSPIGPSELLMLAIGPYVLFHAIKKTGWQQLIRTCSPIILFWGVLLLSCALGAAYVSIKGLPAGENSVHGFLGMMYAGYICMVLYMYFIVYPDNVYKVMAWVIYISIPLLLFAYVFEFIAIKQLGFDESWHDRLLLNTYHGGLRFSGWSINPNQLALFLLILPFVVLHLSNRAFKLYAAALVIIIFWIGWHVRSDALMITWEISAFILMVLFVANKIKGRKENRLLIFPVALAITGIVFYLMSNVIFDKYGKHYNFMSGMVYTKMISGVLSVMEKKEPPPDFVKNKKRNSVTKSEKKTSVRLALMLHSFDAWSKSPLFGLGPGVHSGIDAPHEGMEAHNNFIDILTNSGIVGALAYIVFMLWVLCLTYKCNDKYVFLCLIALMIFSTAHLVIRHPIFWFVVIVFLAESQFLKRSKNIENHS